MTSMREPGTRTRVRFGILGPLSATLETEVLNLGGRRQRGVLAVLLVARGHQVSAARLLDSLWDGKPPKSGQAGLQAYISHLRRALEPTRARRTPSQVLVSRGAGYAIPVDEVDVDAWEFERLVADAQAAADPDRRIALLRDALDLWRGPALAEYAGTEWADAEARRLDELRTVAREQLMAARLDAGESALVVPELEALLAEEPLREERWRLLALALYRSHRQADALAALRRARALLADELGVDPGPALRALEAEVLAQSPHLDGPERAPITAGVPEQRSTPAAESTLVDREAETTLLRDCLTDALAGRPRLALIEGPAGIGKTSLLNQVRQEARAAGATVLTARGSQLEREFGFGAVRQLFDPLLADPAARDELLAGAAAGAGRVFDATAGPSEHQAESLFAVLHGLYWLTGNLAERQPVVIAVDDLQWCDTSSLRFLGYLARRLGDLPVLVVGTRRTGERYADEELLDELAADPEVVAVHPAPLTLPGVQELVHGRLAGADQVFVGACFRTTAGNPLLLRQLLRALEAENVRPDAAHADTVRAIGSRAVSSMVLLRFHRMPATNRQVAQAVAVLGDGASLPMVAAMTGLPEPEAAAAIASLARSEVLRPDYPLGFVHPLVGGAVYDDLPIGERELQHDRAAHVLAAAGASPEQVAAHLRVVPARGDAGVVVVLREAARRDMERGAAESATAYLRRALAEPPTAADLPWVLMDLGRLETLSDGPAAMQHLTAAYDLMEDPAAKADTAIMLARTAVFAGERGQATRFARAAADELDERLVDERQALVALERISAHMHGLDPEEHPLGEVPELAGTGPGARGLAAALAWDTLCAGTDRERALELARFALEDRVLPRADPGLLWVVAAIVLEMGGEDSTALWEEELGHAYRTGGLFAALAVHLWLGYVQWQHGDLREALQSMAHCTEQNELWGANTVGQPYADSFLICMLIDRGDLDIARAALETARTRPRLGEGIRLFGEAEAKLLFSCGDAEGALRVLESVQHEMATVKNPVWRPWRSMRATVLAALGRRDEALALTAEELELARAWGTPGLVGKTLRLYGDLVGGPEGVALLREAVALLAGTPRRLDLTRALLSLAGLLLDEAGGDAHAEKTGEAEAALRRALDLADECAADPLRARAAELLGRLGVDVPTGPSTRLVLTAAERRIATMAGAGMPPSQIAQALFVTGSTVQAVVASVSEQLGAGTLDELREALARA